MSRVGGISVTRDSSARRRNRTTVRIPLIRLLVLPLLSLTIVAHSACATEEMEKLRAEIALLEAHCTPTDGTARADVEMRFGVGQPSFNAKVTSRGGIPPDSSYRAYDFCTNATLFVAYDKDWHVVHANYDDPYQAKGLPAGSAMTPEDEKRELELRLQQMRQIAAEYERRFGGLEHRLPLLTGKVIFAEGSFFGYMPPRAGDAMKLDLEALHSITNRIAFEGKKSRGGNAHYIPLPAPLRIDKIERDQDGRLHLARLISGLKNSDGSNRVIIDMQCFGTKGSMWIIEEDEGIVMSVARLDCQFSMR